MMKKKSQITIFIILGLVILIAISLYLYLAREPIKDLSEEVESDILPEFMIVKNFVDKCVQKTAKQGLLYIGEHGGYYDPNPDESIFYYYTYLPFYINDLGINMPDKSTFENELATYVDERLGECLRGFENFISLGYEIRALPPESKATVGDKNVLVEVKYPLKVIKDDREQDISEFMTTIENVRVLEVLSAAKEHMALQMDNLNYILFGDMALITYDNDLYFTYEQLDEEYVYTFSDPNSSIDEQQFTLYYAVPHSKAEDIESESYIFIDNIPTQIAEAGKEFYLKVDAVGEGLKYYTSVNLFDITDDGIIRFTPTKEDAGDYSGITITVEDRYGNEDYTFFDLIITRDNSDPSIIEETIDAELNTPFEYQVQANDPDNDELIFTLLQSSGGFEMDISGLITSTPQIPGTFPLRISASDDFGGSTEGIITIQVS